MVYFLGHPFTFIRSTYTTIDTPNGATKYECNNFKMICTTGPDCAIMCNPTNAHTHSLSEPTPTPAHAPRHNRLMAQPPSLPSHRSRDDQSEDESRVGTRPLPPQRRHYEGRRQSARQFSAATTKKGMKGGGKRKPRPPRCRTGSSGSPCYRGLRPGRTWPSRVCRTFLASRQRRSTRTPSRRRRYAIL